MHERPRTLGGTARRGQRWGHGLRDAPGQRWDRAGGGPCKELGCRLQRKG